MASNSFPGLGVVFLQGLQDGLIGERGADMVHEIGLACPSCRTSDPYGNQLRDGQLQTRHPNCPRCGGDGLLYRQPALVRGLAVNIHQQRLVFEFGEPAPGDMGFSIGPGTFGDCDAGAAHGLRRVSRDDKFTATWDQPLDGGQTIVRGASTLNENLRLYPNINPAEDRLWYEPSTAIYCEDENGIVYSSSDFELGPGRVIKWSGNQPTVGVKYTIKYTAFFEWIVWAPPKERHDVDGDNLGPLIALRKRHVAFINDSPYITDSDRLSLLSRCKC